MKTADEFANDWRPTSEGAIISMLEARDAEHRDELLKLQDDLLAGADREVMTAALIERLKGELGEAEATIELLKRNVQLYWDGENAARRELAEAKRALGEIQDCTNECYLCDDHRDAPQLGGAPPPAESSCTASVGSCNSPKACGEAGRCIDARMREVVAPTQSTPVLCEQHGREDCPRPDHAVPPDDIRERLELLERWAQPFIDVWKRTGHTEPAALEAKGEPGTHAKGAKP